jgi:E3 ubiquitin-protein ligase DOA10
MCRICLENDFTSDNPFLAPCDCRGGVEHIHLECVKTWLDSKKLTAVKGPVTSFFWDEL